MMSCLCQLHTASLLLIITGVLSTALIDIRRIPDQTSQLRSGDNIVLMCTVTTNTLNDVQWFNGTVLLDGNSDEFIITLPYRLNNGTWQAVMEIVVLTVYSSGWYYCRPDELGYGSIQLSVQDSADDTYLSIAYPTIMSLYATVPFTITCTTSLPINNELQVILSWYRNEEETSLSLDNSIFRISTEYINVTTIHSTIVITEPLPLLDINYKCILKTSKLGIDIYAIIKTTPSLNIEVSPFMSLSLFDTGGPLLDSVYNITCTGVPSVNGSVSLKWINLDNSPVQSRQNLDVGEMFQGVNGSYMVNLTFISISEDDEGLYICHGTSNLFEYPTYSIENTISVNIVAPAQITSLIISALPSNVFDWYVGSDGALICNIQTNRETDNVITEWSSGLLGVINNGSVTHVNGDLYQSVLELRSLSDVHSDVYYCKASVKGYGIKQDWHFVSVESDLPVISVSVLSSLNIPVIGTSYTLYCTSQKPINIQGEPIVSWTKGTNGIIEQDISRVFTRLIDNGTHYISELVFVLVEYNDGGEYGCEIEYNVFGLSQSIKNSDAMILTVQVATPVVNIATNLEGLQCTIQIQDASMSGPSLTVSVLWYLLDNLNNNIIASSVPGIETVDITVIECNVLYQSVLISDNSDILTDYKSVGCNVNVSIDNGGYVISSSNEAIVDFNQLQEKTPSEPNNVIIRETGSDWAEISWTSSDNNVNVNNFQIEYQPLNGGVGIAIADKIYQSRNSAGYNGIITDLIPAMEYNIQVIVKYGNNENKSDIIQFTTNETIPTGIPLNLTRSFSQNGVILTWSPLSANERNGVILYYNVTCDPNLFWNETTVTGFRQNVNQTIMTPQTNISLNGLVIDTVYQCSVAAVNRKGIGPIASIQFSLSTTIGVGGDSLNDNVFQWNLLSIVPTASIGLITLIIIVVFTVTVCYYKRKLKLYFPHTVSKSVQLYPPTSLTTRTTREQDHGSYNNNSNRYVPSDVIGDMFQATERKYNRTTADTDKQLSMTNPLQFELKRMESEL